MNEKYKSSATNLNVEHLKKMHNHLEMSLKNDVWVDGTPQKWPIPFNPGYPLKKNLDYFVGRIKELFRKLKCVL